jgi:dTDP-3-amino-3,4,6-trideoxy-alpha-D-glucopyranose N,N-dimethyltransferase
MYEHFPHIYDEVHSFLDYEGASKSILTTIKHWHPTALSLLDVACGTGRHLEFFKPAYHVEGVDLNPKLIDIAHKRLGSVSLHVGDMTELKLQTSFDVIMCLFGSVAFLKTAERLTKAIAAMALHLNDGGLLLVEPWLAPEQFWRENIKLNTCESSSRKIAWMHVGKEANRIVTSEIHFLVGEPNGVTHFVEVHEMGLFSHENYTDAISAAGLNLVNYDRKGLFGYGLYLARRPVA